MIRGSKALRTIPFFLLRKLFRRRAFLESYSLCVLLSAEASQIEVPGLILLEVFAQEVLDHPIHSPQVTLSREFCRDAYFGEIGAGRVQAWMDWIHLGAIPEGITYTQVLVTHGWRPVSWVYFVCPIRRLFLLPSYLGDADLELGDDRMNDGGNWIS